MTDTNDKTIRLPRTETELKSFVDSLTPEIARRMILPTSDVFARYLLSSEHLKHVTLAFINAVLSDAGREEVSSIVIKNPFSLKDSVTARETVMDVEVQGADGELYDVEIQNRLHDGFYNRMQYYGSRLYCSQYGAGSMYGGMKTVTVIAVLQNDSARKLRKPHRFGTYVDAESRAERMFGMDAVEYHILDLGAFAQPADTCYTVSVDGARRTLDRRLCEWLWFFKNGNKEGFMSSEYAVSQAKEAYEEFIYDRDADMAEFRHRLWVMDRNQEKYDAERAGIRKGMEQGAHDKAVETARNFLAFGTVAPEQIAQATGLPLEEVRSLASNHN